MKCPACSEEKKGHFDRISIRLRQRCCDCHIIWAAKPENDPDSNQYLVKYHVDLEDEMTIYAKTEDDAREEAYGRLDMEYGNNVEIDKVIMIPPPDWKKIIREQTERRMGAPML